MPRAKIHIENCQIKSLEKAIIVADCLDKLEKEIGIHQVDISLKDCFICPDIDLTELANSEEPMLQLLGGLLIKLDKKKYGKLSRYKRLKI